jgi:hypothetical protein
VRVRARWVAAFAVIATASVGCGAHHQSGPGSSTQSEGRLAAQPPALRLSRYPISLPSSASGPTTCTVYEADYATQIVVDSPSLNVRAECELWSANQPGVGYLWGYERAASTPDVLRLCTLIDPKGKMTASVIEDTGFVPISDSQRAKGGSACAAIAASGWTQSHRRARAG